MHALGYIVDQLAADYKFDDGGALHDASDDNPPLAEAIAADTTNHNLQITRFREIVKALEEVKKH